jgi:hypothetical protein
MITEKLIGCFCFVTLLSCSSLRLRDNINSQKSHKVQLPKILRLSINDKQLLYFGTYHSNNPKDTLFELIQIEFQNFEPDFVLHEGNNWSVYSDSDSTISFSGEPGFVMLLSKKYDVKYESIEPKEDDEYKAMLKDYGLDWVVLMYLCRQIDQQQRFMKSHNTTDQQFEKNISYLLNSMKTNGIPIDKEQLTYAYWRKKYLDLLKKDLDWRTFNPIEYYPNYNVTKMNEINRASDRIRNKFMIDKIIEKSKKHQKVMVVVGGGHLLAQEKELQYDFRRNFEIR